MGIYREWPERQRLSNGELEVIGFWVMRQAGIDRTHYAEVEATHKRDIESIYDTLHYWKRQTLSAREESETLKTERDEANKWVSAYLLERNEAHEESERFQRRNDVQAETIDFLQKQNKIVRGQCDELAGHADAYKKERDEARKEAAEEKNARQFSEKVYLLTIEQTINERDEARAESEHHKELAEANQNIAAERYMEIKSLKGQLAAAEQEIKIVRAKVCELECKQAAREALAAPNRPTGRIEAIEARVSNLEAQAQAKPFNPAEFAAKIMPKKSCGCRVGVPECCDTCQNAKLANEALDSLRFAR